MTGIVVLSFAYVLSQFYRTFLAVLSPVLINELGMSEGELAMASAAWFATFAISQFPVGIWLDKYGPRKTASLMHLVFASGGIFTFSIATSAWEIIVAMGLIGIGCAPILMASYVIFARNYSTAIFATLSSTFIAVGMIGSIAGAQPLAIAVESWGWRNVASTLVLISLAIATLIYVLVKSPPLIEVQQKGSYFDLLKIRQLWLLFPLITFSYAIPASIRGLWAGPYLYQVYGLEIIAIGKIVLIMSFAQIAGTLIYGPMDRLFNTRKWVVMSGNIMVLASCIWLALNTNSTLNAITIALIIMAFFGTLSAVQFAHGKAYLPAHLIGRGMTLLNFFSIGGVSLLQFSSGLVVEKSAKPGIPDASFSTLFWFYAVILFVAISIYLFSKDDKPR